MALIIEWAKDKSELDVKKGSDIMKSWLSEYEKNDNLVSGLSPDEKKHVTEKLFTIVDIANEILFSKWKNSNSLVLVWEVLKIFAREKAGADIFSERAISLSIRFLSCFTDQWDSSAVECLCFMTNIFHHSKTVLLSHDKDCKSTAQEIIRVLQCSNETFVDGLSEDESSVICSVQFLCYRLLLQLSNTNQECKSRLTASLKLQIAMEESLDLHISKFSPDPHLEKTSTKEKQRTNPVDVISECFRLAYVLASTDKNINSLKSPLNESFTDVIVSPSATTSAKQSTLIPSALKLFHILKNEWMVKIKVTRSLTDDDPYFSRKATKSTNTLFGRSSTGTSITVLSHAMDIPNHLQTLLPPWIYAIHLLNKYPVPFEDIHDDSEQKQNSKLDLWFPIPEDSEERDFKMVDMFGYMFAFNAKKLEKERKEPTMDGFDPRHPKSVLPPLLTLLIKICSAQINARKMLKQRILPQSMDMEKPLFVGDKTYNVLIRLLMDSQLDSKLQEMMGDFLWVLCDMNPRRFEYYVGPSCAKAVLKRHGFEKMPPLKLSDVDDYGNLLDGRNNLLFRSSSAIDLFHADPSFNDMISKIEKSFRVSDKDRALSYAEVIDIFFPNSFHLIFAKSEMTTLISCPICEKQVEQNEAEIHVNSCLDSISEVPNTSKDTKEPVKRAQKTSIQQWQNFFTSSSSSISSTTTLGYSFQADKLENSSGIPFYKKILGTPFAVDAFSFGKIDGIKAYFLTHFHADHYVGLTSTWRNGRIYCTATTANLVRHKLRVDPLLLVVLPLDLPVLVEGIQVTCPGAVLIEFIIDGGLKILHTGDFRANMKHVETINQRPYVYDLIFLDTTYCNKQYVFPNQDFILYQISTFCKVIHENHKVLFLFGTYLIGKERVFIDVSKNIKQNVYANAQKMKIFECIEDETLGLNELLTRNKDETNIHIVRMMDLNFDSIRGYMESLSIKYEHVIAFRPTGWAHTRQDAPHIKRPKWLQKSFQESTFEDVKLTGVSADEKIILMSVSYSEHSSFEDLEMFCKGVRWKRIIPTVNVDSDRARREMENQFQKWKSAK